MQLSLSLIVALAAAPASTTPTCAPGQARRAASCRLPPSVEPLAADAAPEEALGLAQRTKRALLAPRTGGRRASARLPPIGFVKTHKTGGSTLANILHRLGLERNLSILQPNTGGVITWPKLLEEEAPNHQYDMFCNHEMFNETAARAYLKPSPVFFSIVREPLSMMDSRFRWKETKYAVPPSTWAMRLDALRTSKQVYANPLARDFGWYDGVDIRRVTLGPGDDPFRRDNDTEAVARFIEQLDRALDFVFPTDRYDEGLVLLGRRLGLSLDDMTYVRIKVSSAEHEPAPPTAEELSDFREFISVDQAIWDHFSKRFNREWEAAGGDAALGPEVEELRRRNAELEEACAEPRDRAACPLLLVLDSSGFNRLLTFRALLDRAGAPELSPDDVGDLYRRAYHRSIMVNP